jgi:hypothetical protein
MVADASTTGGGEAVIGGDDVTGVRGITGPEEASFLDGNFPCWSAGDLWGGTVLLRARPPVGVVARAEPPGLGAPFEWRECLEDVDLFLRILPSFLTLSAPALALEAVLTTPDFSVGIGVVGECAGAVAFWRS